MSLRWAAARHTQSFQLGHPSRSAKAPPPPFRRTAPLLRAPSPSHPRIDSRRSAPRKGCSESRQRPAMPGSRLGPEAFEGAHFGFALHNPHPEPQRIRRGRFSLPSVALQAMAGHAAEIEAAVHAGHGARMDGAPRSCSDAARRPQRLAEPRTAGRESAQSGPPDQRQTPLGRRRVRPRDGASSITQRASAGAPSAIVPCCPRIRSELALQADALWPKGPHVQTIRRGDHVGSPACRFSPRVSIRPSRRNTGLAA